MVVWKALMVGWGGEGEKWVRSAMLLEKAALANGIRTGRRFVLEPAVHRLPQILSHGFHYSTSLLKP